VVNNYLRDIKVKDVKEYEKELYFELTSYHQDILSAISQGESLKDTLKEKLDQALQKFTEKFIQSRS
jgi:F0F1-type ATP synthase alpha subunit